MRKRKKYIRPQLSFFLVFFSLLTAEQPQPNWDNWKFLIGNWTGSVGGAIKGGTRFYFDLGQNVIVRNNFASYAGRDGNPPFDHFDLMTIYREGTKTRAIYFDNEGHVLHYTAEISEDGNRIIFLSDPGPDTPRFRLTYTRIAKDKLQLNFDIASPGSTDFTPYITGSLIKNP